MPVAMRPKSWRRVSTSSNSLRGSMGGLLTRAAAGSSGYFGRRGRQLVFLHQVFGDLALDFANHALDTLDFVRASVRITDGLGCNLLTHAVHFRHGLNRVPKLLFILNHRGSPWNSQRRLSSTIPRGCCWRS